MLGKHSGIAAILHALQELGLPTDERRARVVLDRVRDRAVQAKAPVRPAELLEFYAAASRELLAEQA